MNIAILTALVAGGLVGALDVSEPTEISSQEVESSIVESSESEEEVISSSSPVSSEEEPEPVNCYVTYNLYHLDDDKNRIKDATPKYGDVYFSATEGYVGDEVKAIISGNPDVTLSKDNVALYKWTVSVVELNGVQLNPSDAEKGEYTFTLEEGVNTLDVVFGNKAEISVLDLATTDWKSLFTVDNLVKVLYLCLSVVMSSGFLLTLIKNAKLKVAQAKAIADTAVETGKQSAELFDQKTQEFLQNVVQPLIQKQGEQTNDSNETTKALMRVMLLAQENTDSARLAIIKELQDFKNSDKNLAEQIQSIVQSRLDEYDEKQKEKEQAIAEAKKTLESLNDTTDESEPIDYGTV